MARPNLSHDSTIVILTGAGISKESGLDTFRDPDGVWSKYSVEEVATPNAFARDPKLVHDFYNMRRKTLQDPEIEPNAAHIAIARLQADWPGRVVLVTQNVDDLHERGGSKQVLHMHGELRKIECQHCTIVTSHDGDLSVDDVCPDCGTVGSLRPHVVWFGEMPRHMEEIAMALADADLFISIGTSGNVYPAAGFVAEARQTGAHTIELNLEPSEGATLFAETRYGPASELVPDYVEELLDLAAAPT
ncbi:MAG: NAD-dependent protein deacylase [Alphaproteobacteria bacterium]|nr:NAD-dependent protein deacylase [Alphaproteobacteria bacterium SS10]